MKTTITTFFLILFFAQTGWSQKALEGLWTGTLTQGETEYRYELYIKRKKRNKLEARSLIYLTDTTYVEMAASGIIHSDWSINLYDFELVQPKDAPEEDFFIRTYQLLFRREFNDYFIKGWWQEKEVSTMDPKRRQGYIYLEKSKPNKA